MAAPWGFNWLALAWAQYQREVNNITAFTDRDNWIALGLSFAWNVSQMFINWYLVGGVLQFEDDWEAAQLKREERQKPREPAATTL